MKTLSKKINIGNLKVKHVLEIQSEFKNYPTPEDILYEAIRDYSSRTAQKDIQFTDKFITDKYSIPSEKTTIILTWLKENGYLEIIRETKGYTTYKVIKNPYSK